MSACEGARARVRVSQWGCGRARGGVSARGGRGVGAGRAGLFGWRALRERAKSPRSASGAAAPGAAAGEL